MSYRDTPEADDNVRQWLEEYGPPMTATEDAAVTAFEDLFVRGAFDDIAPAPPGPPCQHDGCEWTLATNGHRWWHQERADLDNNHDAEPCPCDVIAGIVVNPDAWCPLHGAEDALSGAVWANPATHRHLASELAP